MLERNQNNSKEMIILTAEEIKHIKISADPLVYYIHPIRPPHRLSIHSYGRRPPLFLPPQPHTPQHARLLLLALIKNLDKLLPHLSRLLARINSLPDSPSLVVSNNRERLLVVCYKTLLEGVGIVV